MNLHTRLVSVGRLLFELSAALDSGNKYALRGRSLALIDYVGRKEHSMVTRRRETRVMACRFWDCTKRIKSKHVFVTTTTASVCADSRGGSAFSEALCEIRAEIKETFCPRPWVWSTAQ